MHDRKQKDIKGEGAKALKSMVVRPAPKAASDTQHPLLQLQRKYGNRYVQRTLELARETQGEGEVALEVEGAIKDRQGGGHPLDKTVRTRMESAFNSDFSGVNVHTDKEADALNRQLNARAFTTGRDIFFRQGHYAPGSSGGRELLAHELTHVVQQTGGMRRKMTMSQPGDPQEQEADEVARAVIMQEQQRQGGARPEENEEEILQTKPRDSRLQRQVEDEEELLQTKRVSARKSRSGRHIGRGHRVVQRWAAGEHLELGKAAGVNQVIVHPGDVKRGIPRYTIPYAEIPPFGDYYSSFADIRKEAETAKGRRKLDYLRWKFRKEAGQTAGSQPKISAAEKEEITILYRKLAGKNFAHFASGNRARNEYRKYHEQGLRGAFLAGFSNNGDLLKEALAKEAFGMHFYTDAFSAGHIRTPRMQIDTWYKARFPKAFKNFIDTIGSFMADKMAKEYWTASTGDVKPEVMKILWKKAGPYKGIFSLGDIISGAIHDAEGKGLDVVSQSTPSRTSLHGGYKWKAVGDAMLKKSPQTMKIMKVAIQESTQEIYQAYKLGQQQAKIPGANAQNLVNTAISANFMVPYLAENFMPAPDPLLKPVGQQYPWEWGKFDTNMKNIVHQYIKSNIVPQLKSVSKGVKKVHVHKHWLTGTYYFHPQRAFNQFVTVFESNPVFVLELILGKKSGP